MNDSNHASICLLSFNRPKLVKQTISSAIVNAGYPIELIVHDDGSDQETVDVLRELHRNGLISLLMLNAPGHNEGQGVALNRMFTAATGDPIIKMDHDLVLEPDWLEESVAILRANQDAYHGGFEKQLIGALGLFKYDHPPVRATEMFVTTHMQDDYLWEEHKDFVGSAMVIPRMTWEELGPFEERSPAFAEDAMFKKWITESPSYYCALPPNDLAQNVGFGLGPSTVNIPDSDGEPTVQPIKSEPMIITYDD
jgi:glycosyltransferase involved in cell wall biosynthesis